MRKMKQRENKRGSENGRKAPHLIPTHEEEIESRRFISHLLNERTGVSIKKIEGKIAERIHRDICRRFEKRYSQHLR